MSSYATDALAIMHNTGDAYLDHEGCIVESGEYVAALYESYAADQEWSSGTTYLNDDELFDTGVIEYGTALASLGRYCRAAQMVAEELWTRDVEEVTAAQESEYDRWIFENWGN